MICCSLSLNLQGQNTTLRYQVLQQLDICIDSCYQNMIVTQTSPLNNKEVVMVIPVIVEGSEEEEYMELDRYVVIADATTGKIHHLYHGSGSEGWTSDAVMLWDVSVEDTVYRLSDEKQAIGVWASFKNGSRHYPFYEKQLTLLVPEADSLRPVLLDHVMEMSRTLEAGFEECSGKYEQEKNKLKIMPVENSKYGNIHIMHRVYTSFNHLNSSGKCVESETLQMHTEVLEYKSERYR